VLFSPNGALRKMLLAGSLAGLGIQRESHRPIVGTSQKSLTPLERNRSSTKAACKKTNNAISQRLVRATRGTDRETHAIHRQPIINTLLFAPSRQRMSSEGS
jgi:hypothetical protein